MNEMITVQVPVSDVENRWNGLQYGLNRAMETLKVADEIKPLAKFSVSLDEAFAKYKEEHKDENVRV